MKHKQTPSNQLRFIIYVMPFNFELIIQESWTFLSNCVIQYKEIYIFIYVYFYIHT